VQTDILIIGSGQAGVPLATRLVKDGKRVTLVERGQPGGTCVNTGCTPTKTLLASAHAAHGARTAARLGVHVRDVTVDFAEVIARKDRTVAQWRAGVKKRIEGAAPGLTFVKGHARFVAERTVEVNGERYQAAQVVIDVGGRPKAPSVKGLSDVPWLDNHRLMDLRTLPSHLVVLGGGYVGCEFAQMFLRFGSKVTLVHQGEPLLLNEDRDISDALETALQEEGMTRVGNAQVTSASKTETGVQLQLADGRKVEGSHLLVATGRQPNTDDLGCEVAGISLDPHGAIRIDEHYRTSAPGVFAVGDCTPEPKFTHVAWDDFRLLLEILRGKPSRDRTQRLIPYTLFTEPQLASVGLKEHEAVAKGIPHEVARYPFSSVARAIENDLRPGLIKVLVDPNTEHLLGASIVGAEAGELLHVFFALMQAKASARNLVDMQCIHPTYAEGLQSTLMTLPRFLV
jgi:pyruvate/2-oxoglutarate dehydrogenase complex dihydrolipoamide dehydrogenase (E3) component